MAKKNHVVLLMSALFLCGGWHWFEPAARKVAGGIAAFEKEQFEKALDAFVSAKGNAPESDLLRFNTAAALLRMNKAKEALEELSQIREDGSLGKTAGLHYNKGNAHFMMQEFQEALGEYRQALRIDPQDLQVKRNYELTLKKIREQDQQKQDQQKQEDRQDQQKQDQNKDLMDYLNQNEREQQNKQRRKQAVLLGREKDW